MGRLRRVRGLSRVPGHPAPRRQPRRGLRGSWGARPDECFRPTYRQQRRQCPRLRSRCRPAGPGRCRCRQRQPFLAARRAPHRCRWDGQRRAPIRGRHHPRLHHLPGQTRCRTQWRLRGRRAFTAHSRLRPGSRRWKSVHRRLRVPDTTQCLVRWRPHDGFPDRCHGHRHISEPAHGRARRARVRGGRQHPGRVQCLGGSHQCPRLRGDQGSGRRYRLGRGSTGRRWRFP